MIVYIVHEQADEITVFSTKRLAQNYASYKYPEQDNNPSYKRSYCIIEYKVIRGDNDGKRT